MALQMPVVFHTGCLGLRTLLGWLIKNEHKHFFRSDHVLFMSVCLGFIHVVLAELFPI